jgi:superfamily II DNA or RNA helicase
MWFDPSVIARGTNAAGFAKGFELFRSQHVIDCQVQPDPAFPKLGWIVSGHVQGTQREPYVLQIALLLQADGRTPAHWRSFCSCPVSLQCKHAVALLLKAAHERDLPVADTGKRAVAAPAKKPDELAREAAERQREAELARRREQARQLNVRAQQWLNETAGNAHADLLHKQARLQTPLYLLESKPARNGAQVLHLHLGSSTQAVRGGWTKPRLISTDQFLYNYRQDAQLTDEDQAILRLLAALPRFVDPYRYQAAGEWVLDHVAAAPVLQRASDSGRLFMINAQGYPDQPMRWGPSQAVEWTWVREEGPDVEQPLWRLKAQLPDAQTVVCANLPMLYLDRVQGLVGPIQGGDSAHQQALLMAPPLPEDLMHRYPENLLRRLGNDVPLPPVLPPTRRVGGSPLWRLHISPLTETGLADDAPPQALCAQLDFDYEGVQGWWPGKENPVLTEQHDGTRVLVTRDLASERQALQGLERMGLTDIQDGLFVLEPEHNPVRWLQWSESAFQPFKDAGFQVTTDAALRDWVRHGGELAVALDAHGAADPDAAQTADWFDLSLGLELDGERINLLPWLPQIIADLRQAEQAPEPVWPEHLYLPQPGGHQFLRMSTAPLKPWLDALLELFDDRRTDFDAHTLRLSRIDALRAGMALGEGVVWDGARDLLDLVQGLQNQRELPATPLPKGLNAELRPYQQHGLDWLQFLRRAGLNGILADDMGLGKTLQTLAHLQCEKEAGRLDRPALVIAPVSLLGNWRREAQRFCPDLRCLVLHGAERHEQVADMARVDLVIAPYSLLHRDRERWLAQPWHLVVLDEAHHIKNAATQAFQVVTELDTRHRLSLSGTPIENHLGELWSQFHFLMPGFLGRQTRFTQRFRTPIEKHGDGQRMAALRTRVTPFILRRHKSEVATELPPKVESVMPVAITGKQADLYETIRLAMEVTVRQAMADKGLAKSQITILDALLKLRQVCCDPRLVKTAAAAKVKTSAKLDQLMEMLPEMLAEGRRILLFSAFTSMLTLIEDELKKRQIAWVKLTGQTQKRDEVIERFTSGQVPLFLISLKAGGVGLNLPQADTVIHYDPWWNPAAENQATDRAHRIGQTQSVWVVKLVAQGTIEERILSLQERKAQLARELYSGAQARKQPLFTAEDVQALLQPLG